MRSHRKPSPAARAALAGLAIVLGAAACASAEKRYEQGVQLEQQGRPADAAARYIDALEKDRSLVDARARLQETGDRAVRDYLAEAVSTEAAGYSGSAADVLLRLDALRRKASTVGVTLAVPADYATHRRGVFDRALERTLYAAGRAAERREFRETLAQLDLTQRWEPTPQQRARVDEARFDAQLGWAEDDAAAGRFRAAYDRAAQAARVYGDRPEMARRAVELQEDVLRRGTLRVAILPPESSVSQGRLPAGLLRELQDHLETEEWRSPPRFVDLVDPLEVRREIRRRGTPPGGVMGTREAAIVGRALDAEVAVLLVLDSVAPLETVTGTVRRPARTQQGADTAYTLREGRRETWSRVSYLLVDVETRQVLDRGTVSADGSARFRRAVYAGDWRTLALNRDERELFQADRDDEDRAVVGSLAPEMAERLGREVLDRLLQRVD